MSENAVPPVDRKAVIPNALEQSDISILAIVAVPIRHVRLVLVPALMFGVFALLYGLLAPSFESRSSFLPQGVEQGNLSNYAGLAAQLGFTLRPTNPGGSVDFYGRLVRSPEILKEAVLTKYTFSAGDDGAESRTGNLMQIYGIRDSRHENALLRAMSELKSNVAVDVDEAAGVVSVTTVSRWRDLTPKLNRRLLELVNEFNLKRRQSEVTAERIFVEGRLRQAQKQLAAAEDTLEAFLERNRVREAPQLEFEQGRLQRRVELQQQVYVSLAKAFEQARIEEVRNTPVITVVDPPEDWVRRRGNPFVRAGLAGLGGLFVGLVFAFGAEFLQRQRSEYQDDYEALKEAGEKALKMLLPRFVRRGHVGSRAPDQQADE